MSNKDTALTLLSALSSGLIGIAIIDTWTRGASTTLYLWPISATLATLILLDQLFKHRSKLAPPVEKFVIALPFFVLGLAIRISLFNIETGDYNVYFHPLYQHIEQNGFAGYQDRVNGINLLLQYLIGLTTLLPLPALYSLKALSIVFEMASAAIIYLIVQHKYPRGMVPLAAAISYWFLPTVIVNGSMWLQYDSIYTTFLLATLYVFITTTKKSTRSAQRRRYRAALALFAFGFAIKLQSVFFALPLTVLVARRQIRWLALLIIPTIFIITLTPARLAGRSWNSLLSVYPQQINQIASLIRCQPISCTPSLFHLTGSWPSAVNTQKLSVVIAITSIFALTLYLTIKKVPLTPSRLVQLSLISTLTIPFLLIGMYSRYMYPADVFAIVYAFYFPTFWYFPIVVSGISLINYTDYLIWGQTPLPLSPITMSIIIAIAIGILMHQLIKPTAPDRRDQAGNSTPNRNPLP